MRALTDRQMATAFVAICVVVLAWALCSGCGNQQWKAKTARVYTVNDSISVSETLGYNLASNDEFKVYRVIVNGRTTKWERPE